MLFRNSAKARRAKLLTTSKAPRRPAMTVGVSLLVAIVIYIALPEPRTKKSRTPPTTAELKALVNLMTTTERPGFKPRQKFLASLGRKLFNDKRLSANQLVSCASCHNADLSFTDGRTVGIGIRPGVKNAPAVINHFLNSWFMWDGQADSLAAQALKPVEDPNEQGFSRLGVTWALMTYYEKDYQEAFGEFPNSLKAWTASNSSLPKAGLPEPEALAVSEKSLDIDLAAYALATLGRFKLLNDILGEAQKIGRAPALELSRRAFAPPEGTIYAPEAYKAFAALSPDEKDGVNQVFANFALAIAEFERGLVALDSPFDRFAARFAQSPDAESALDPTFDAKAFEGLVTFVTTGQCTLCHAGANFTDQQFHNIGLPQLDDRVDLGRATGMLKVMKDPFNCEGAFLKVTDPEQALESCKEMPFLSTTNLEMVGAFKTPSLRNVAATAPYMHDGRFKTLGDVLEHYNTLEAKPAVGHREESLKPLELTEKEILELEAFLKTLTSPVTDMTANTVVWKP